MNCLTMLYLRGVGINPGKQTVYHMCKTWLQRYTVGGIWGGGDF